MNMAKLYKLPVIYACENNLYGEYTHFSETTAGNILDRPKAFDIESFEVDGQDVLAVYELSKTLVKRARDGDGPFFIQLNTYRYHGHHVGDIDREYYRSKEEEKHWKENRDPIKILAEYLVSKKWASSKQLTQMELDIKNEAKEAVEYAINAPYPDVSEVDMHVFK
jgi:pyruvate dehydrogenase E1 component alpha subunit